MSEARTGELGGGSGEWHRVRADDGLDLYCETVGSGPPVVVMQGAIGEAGATAQLAGQLAGKFTVISYDRRGVSRSSSADPADLDRHASDAAQIIKTLANGSAAVIGSSIGALIGAHLAVSYPSTVELLVAHEPPMRTVVLDETREAALDRVFELAGGDVFRAVKEMGRVIGGTGEVEPEAKPAQPVGDVKENLQRFFRNDFVAVRSSWVSADHIVDVSERVRVIPAGGELSRGGWENRCAQVLADRLGIPLVELPGGHDSLTTHPHGSAAVVTRLVRG